MNETALNATYTSTQSIGTQSTLYNNSTDAIPVEEGTTAAAEIDLPLTFNIIFFTTSAIGFIANVCIFAIVLARHKSKWKKHLILLMNIMVCDMVISVAGIMINSAEMAKGELEEDIIANWPSTEEKIGLHRRLGCTAMVGVRLWDVGTNANLFGLLLMTIDHLIAVHWSLKHATVITKRWVIMACSGAWALALLLGFLDDMILSPSRHPDIDRWPEKGTTHYCYQKIIYEYKLPDGTFEYDFNQQLHITVSSSIDICVIAVVFICMLAVYSYISAVVISISRRRKTQDNRFKATKQNLKGVGTTVLLLSTFLILYTPLSVYYFVQAIGSSSIGDTWSSIFAVLVSLTAIVDVLIYGCRDKDVQAALTFRSSKSKSKYQTCRTQGRTGTSDNRLSTAITTRGTSRDDSSKATSLISLTPSHSSNKM